MKKQITFVMFGLALWGIVAWLFIDAPMFVVNALPSLLPLAVFAFLLFLSGLLLLTGVLLSCVRFKARRFSWMVILLASSIVVLYNISPLAPAWACFGKRLYVVVVNAAGENCTEKCTSWAAKACSGWSSCYGKSISCNSAGRDQDGRGCQGCCFSCRIECDDEPDLPPTISSSIVCSQWGSNGWCVGTETLNLTAADPQNYTLNITGSIGGIPFTCATGKTCSRTLPDGDGTISYKVTASQSGKIATGSTSWKRDGTMPDLMENIPSPTGSNGWFNTVPVMISPVSSDSLSGLANAQVSVNGGAWQSSASLDMDGVYAVDFRVDDNAGNVVTSSSTISIDTALPAFTTSTDGTAGNAPWYISYATTTISPSDVLSGVDQVEYNENDRGWQLGTSFVSQDGSNTISIRVRDIAGNVASGSISVNVDTVPPVIIPSASGTTGSNGWLITPVLVSAVVTDATSGVGAGVDVSIDDGASWQNTTISLSDGVYAMAFRAFDVAGNEGTASLKTYVDTVNPELGFVFSGKPGSNGWYVSDVTVSTTASDMPSGVDYSEMRVNGGSWQLQQKLSDGEYDLEARAGDLAGNIKTITDKLRVDTKVPDSEFISHKNNDVVSGTVRIMGSSADGMSGVQSVDISTDGGATWKEAVFSKDTWSYDWDTTTLQNGSYVVKVRGMDTAGNREMPVSLVLLVDNLPPFVKITNSWLIWERGEISISANGFDVSRIRVTISDPQGRWPSVEFIYDPNTTITDVIWDRRFADGTIAPFGNYHVTVSACDIYGNCASDRGVISVPFIAPIPPAATPSSVPSSAAISNPTAVPSLTPHSSSQPSSPALAGLEPEQPDVAEPNIPFILVLAVVSLIALMWALSSAVLADRRYKAILAISRTISQRKDR